MLMRLVQAPLFELTRLKTGSSMLLKGATDEQLEGQ